MIRHLGLCLLPALQKPEEASRLFVDLVTGAALAHLAHHYGKLPLPRRLPRGGLASWQERRAEGNRCIKGARNSGLRVRIWSGQHIRGLAPSATRVLDPRFAFATRSSDIDR